MNRTDKVYINVRELEENLEYSKAKFLDISKKFKKGYCTDSERKRAFNNTFSNGFWRFIQKKGLKTRFNEESYNRFLDDYQLYQMGLEPDSQMGDWWLTYDFKMEASLLDKKSFFLMIDAYLISVDLFEPLPSEVINPHRRIAMYGTGMAGSVKFWLKDDGGLFSDENPVGKTFILVDKHGLKANLKILRYSNYADNNNNRFQSKFIGFGTIEGHTSSREREIQISDFYSDSKPNNNLIALYTTIDNDDLNVFYDYPLWKEFNEHESKKIKIQIEHIQTLVDYYEKLLSDNK